MGCVGVWVGTRFLATKESDFHQIWKEQVVQTGDRGTLVARGVVGPARWLKTTSSKEHQKQTLEKSPGVYLDTPDDFSTIPIEMLNREREGIDALFHGERDEALHHCRALIAHRSPLAPESGSSDSCRQSRSSSVTGM